MMKLPVESCYTINMAIFEDFLRADVSKDKYLDYMEDTKLAASPSRAVRLRSRH